MKLMVAMGLQLDNGQSRQLALTLGQGHAKPEPPQKNPAIIIDASRQYLTPVSGHPNALLTLTYSLGGLPVPFMLDATRINLFA